MKRFQEKTILVTGAASGIGRATALAFAREGAQVVVSDVNHQGGQETVALIAKENGTAIYLHADVSQKSDVIDLVQKSLDRFGKLDIAINNAGIGGDFLPTAQYPDKAWEQIIAVNQTGVFYCMREELKHMAQNRQGCIVNVASIAGLKAMPNASAYVASKHAVVGLTKTAALEYARMNIRVNAVCPVFTRSPLFDKMFDIDPSYEEKLKRNIPMRRYGQTADIANAILWLSDDTSDFVTGLALPIDGGMMA